MAEPVVPWIAMWSAERVGPEMVEGPRGIEPVPGAKHVRRENGMWMLHGPDNRNGTPDFGSTHSRRQREAMRRVLCQVCGQHRRNEMRWVIPDNEVHIALWNEGRAINAPVCEPCLELATELCPHLHSTPPYAITAGTSIPVAITGDYMRHGYCEPGVLIELTSPMRVWVLGRELVVAVMPT